MPRRQETETGPIDRDERLGEAIETYLELAEAGPRPDPEAFAAGYPELGDDLVAALQGLALVQGLVGDSGGAGPGHRLEAGRRVAGYRIVRELGRGGMGIVYEAVHVGLDRPVALKVLGTQAAPDSTGRRRFLNEARTAAGLHHTHIVPVFDVGQVGGLCYYAMQRIEGSGLDRVLRLLRRDRSVAAGSTYGSNSPRPGSPAVPAPALSLAAEPSLGDETRTWAGGASSAPWRKGAGPIEDDAPTFVPPRGGAYYRWVADVGRQAAEALSHAHHQGVIHRDIKPSNLLVDDRGSIWVADFGLARRLADPSQTQLDSLLGTPRYMSPEQARTGAIDGRSDVYSLGATLYELVALRPPFDGRSAAELVEQIAGREPLPPRKFDPRIPLDLETILLKALAKRPDDRYASAEELADDLGRFLAHEPVKARRIGPLGRLWRFARRHPALSAVTTASAATILTVATVAYVRIAAERDRAYQASDDARKAGDDARRARRETELAYDKLQKANDETRAELRDKLASQATMVLLSNVADRRSKGLALLHRAADLGPAPGLRLELRDQALAFLALRDVEAGRPIPTPKLQQGLAFTPDGRRIASISDDGELNVWDVARRELYDSSRRPVGLRRPPPGTPSGRGAGARMAAMGGAGQLAVIRPDGDGLGFFDVASPTAPVEELPMPGHKAMSLLATPDGRRFLTVERTAGPQGEPRMALWGHDRAEGPRATLTLPEPKAEPMFGRGRGLLLAIAPDGSAIAATRFGESQVALWDGDGRPLPPVEVQSGVWALSLGPGGLLAVAEGTEIALWDLSPRRPLPGLGPRQGFVSHLRFSPGDGALLAAAGPEGVELWDLATHQAVASLPTRGRVEDLAFSPDGRSLAASHVLPTPAPPDGRTGASPAPPSEIALWSVVEPAAQVVLPVLSETPTSLAFGPDGELAIASRDGSLLPAPLRVWEGDDRSPTAIASWDHIRAGAVGFDEQGLMIALESRRLSWSELPDPLPVFEVEIPDHRRYRPSRGDNPFAEPRPGRSADGTPTRDKDVGPPRPPSEPGRPPAPIPTASGLGRPLIPALARSEDGRVLAFARPGDVMIWREEAPDDVARLDLPDWATASSWGGNALFALSPDGSRIYFGSQAGDRLACCSLPGESDADLEWTVALKEPISLATSPDGLTLAVGERGGAFVLVDAARGEVVRRVSPPGGGAPQQIDSLAFSPDGKTLAVGGRDLVRLWSVAGDPAPLAHLPGLRGRVRALAFDDWGRRLAGGDENRTVRIWDLDSLREQLARLGLGW